jgi:hypothetical protein
MRKILRVLALTLMLIMLLPAGVQTYAQEQENEYIAETGHWISGEFLHYYRDSANSLLLLGYPITDAFIDPITGLTVQYFQKIRLELQTDPVNGTWVAKSPLGAYLYKPGSPVDISTNTPACRFFKESLHSVCYEFLNFYDTYGGITQFGFPISELEISGNRFVQQFQMGRMEWYPELPPGQRVVLANLGRMYFDQHGENAKLLEPSRSSNIPQSILTLQAHAFVAAVIVPSQSEQTLFVIVQDQNLNPVSHAIVSAIVVLPDGIQAPYVANPTNEFGITTLTFPIGVQSPGAVIDVQVNASYGGITTGASTWFRVWW